MARADVRVRRCRRCGCSSHRSRSANTAAAMRPPVDAASRWRFVARFHAAMVRVFALSLGSDARDGCVHRRDRPVGVAVRQQPGLHQRTLADEVPGLELVGEPTAAGRGRRWPLPLAVILTLWFLARAVVEGARRGARDRREALTPTRTPWSITRTALDHPSMWDDREPSEYLRHVHVGAAFSLVTAMAAVGVAYACAGSSTRWRCHRGHRVRTPGALRLSRRWSAGANGGSACADSSPSACSSDRWRCSSRSS